MYICPELQKRISQNPDDIVAIVLGGTGFDHRTLAALEKQGFEVTDTHQLTDFGTLAGRIRAADIEKLQAVEGLDFVEEDSEQSIS